MGLGEAIGILIFIIIVSVAFWKRGFHLGTDEFRRFRKEVFNEFYNKDDKDKKE